MWTPWKGSRRELCPFCFEHFKLGETPFRCTSPALRCAPVPDPVLAAQWGDNRPLGKVLPAADKFTRSVRCGDCNNVSRKRLCPTCHSNLPHTTGDFKNYIFAVIGAKEAGKSHYISVLIDQIKKHIGPSMNMLLEPMSDDTIRRYREDFYNPIFADGRTIKATVSATADIKVQRPLVYSMTMTGENFFGKDVIRDAIVLVFFDTAGEDLNDEDVLSIVAKYIYRSDGILLLVDPLQIPKVRAQLNGRTALPVVNSESSDIMTRITRLVERGRELKPMSKIPIPLAVAFSKFDAVGSLVDDQFQLNFAIRHDGGFDTLDFEAINDEMEALLNNWGGADLVHQVQTHYKKYGFFGLSALGCNPHGTQEIPHVLPKRVEDPFLWLLFVNGLIPRAKK